MIDELIDNLHETKWTHKDNKYDFRILKINKDRIHQECSDGFERRMSTYDFMWEVYKDNIKPNCNISDKLCSDIKDGIDSEITIIKKS